ncbi:hypothetical protein [Pseudorhodobacter ferrugineus]|uniref:hypothetical protein n=1 Tax=Pseudorhodobacter ferrugineus TaxID=77008 RepID=UPI0003B41570|nr:hypothetical protein [Pseudorhodobacter ferrugineus]
MDIRWDQLTELDWQACLAPQSYGLRQDWNFGLAMQQMGANVGRAAIFDGTRLVAIAQVMQRRGVRVLGQGPVWLEPLDEGQKRHIVRRLACHTGATIVTPTKQMAGWGLVPLITPKSYAHWSINHPADILRKGLQGKWRNRLLKAEAAVTPHLLGKRGVAELVTREAATRTARGYANLPGDLAKIWGAGSLCLGWHMGGALQAGMVFLIHGQTATYFLGWASDAARQAFAHGPMLWQAALTLQNSGVRLIDLGDVNSGTGANLARFKLGTGADVVAQGPTCLVVPSR